MEEFLIGAGLALLLALLAWSDQIKNLHKETLDLEKEFSQNRSLPLRKIRKIIRSESRPAQRISAINNLLKNSEIKEKKDIEIINSLINLDPDRLNLEKLNKRKYRLVIALTYLFIISGMVNYFIIDTSSFNLFCLQIKLDFIAISACIVLLLLIITFTAYLNKIENNYKEQLYHIIDEI